MQHAGFAHDADVHRIADMDAVQLGFLEVAFHVEGVRIHHRQHRAASVDVVAQSRQPVVQVAIDRAEHAGALQVELGEVDRGLRLRQRGLALLDLGQAFFHHFLGDDLGQGLAAACLTAGLREHGTLRRRGSLGLLQREREAVAVDLEQRLPALHALVVLDQDLGHQPGHVRRDLHHVRADMAVAGPWRHRVVIPQVLDDDDRDRGDDKGKDDGSKRTKIQFHDCSR